MIHAGVAGCGKIAQVRHLPDYADRPDVQVWGLFDLNPDRARELRQEAIKESDPATHHDGKFCTMCGPDFCSVRLSAKLKKLLK